MSINALSTAAGRDAELNLLGWGCGDGGQLGAELKSPTRPRHLVSVLELVKASNSGLEAIAAGGMHSLALDTSGRVWSFGINDEGALGRATVNVPNPEKPAEILDEEEVSSTPHIITSLDSQNFRAVKIAAADNVSAVVSDQGRLLAWGNFRDAQGTLGFYGKGVRQFTPVEVIKFTRRSGVPEKAVDVHAGDNHLLVLTTHGHVFTLGVNDAGQLGRKILPRHKLDSTMAGAVRLGRVQKKAACIGTGNNGSFAVDVDGDVWAWGLNRFGQTGTGRASEVEDIVYEPKKVIGLGAMQLGGSEKVIQVTGGEFHTLFLTSEGRVYACGATSDHQLGLADDDPAFASDPADADESSNADDTDDAAHADDPTHADDAIQTDDPTPAARTETKYIATPSLISFPAGTNTIKHVSAGPRYSVAVAEDGAMFSWGAGSNNELGLGGDQEEAVLPTPIKVKNGWKGVSVSSGGQHVLALSVPMTDHAA